MTIEHRLMLIKSPLMKKRNSWSKLLDPSKSGLRVKEVMMIWNLSLSASRESGVRMYL